jgi:hypothetical protein
MSTSRAIAPGGRGRGSERGRRRDCSDRSPAQERSSSTDSLAFCVGCLLAERAESTARLQLEPAAANARTVPNAGFVAERHSSGDDAPVLSQLVRSGTRGLDARFVTANEDSPAEAAYRWIASQA